MKYIPLIRDNGRKKVYQREIKQTNMKHAFDLIRSGVCTSRADLTREMKLSATAISTIVDELICNGLIAETGPIQAETPGRRPMNLRLNEDAHQLAVLSLCSNQLRFTLYNLNFKVLEEFSISYASKISRTDARGDEYSRLFEEVLLEKSRMLDRSRLLAVCVTYPGIYLTHDEFLSAHTSLDTVIKEETINRFTEKVGVPLLLANKSMATAYAEIKQMAEMGEKSDDLIFVSISGVVGSAVISNGMLVTGPNGTAGDIAHVRVGFEGRSCACGNSDCLHHYLNLDALLKDAQAACEEKKLPAPQSFEQLAEIYGKNEAIDGIVEAAADRLSIALSNLLYFTSMDRVVIGGGIRALGEKFLQAVSERLNRLIYARNHSLSYAISDDNADSIGIVQYFLDKTDQILADHYRREKNK